VGLNLSQVGSGKYQKTKKNKSATLLRLLHGKKL